MSKKAVVPGGFYLKARKIQQSSIQHAPPHVRETWDWLLMKANHADAKCNGRVIKRGQVFCSWKDIQEALHWTVGYRKMRYSQFKVEFATKWLLAAKMITATKTVRGRIITIVNYDLYQNPANYEYRNERRSERHCDAEGMPNDKQEYNNKKNKNNKYSEQDFKLAESLWELIHENHPHLPRPDLESWVDEVRKMREIDNRTSQQIEAIFCWSQADDFWSKTALSAAFYRKKSKDGVKHIDRIEGQMKKPQEQNYGSDPFAGVTHEADEAELVAKGVI